MAGGLRTWGGDAKVVASNAEIERVLATLQACESWLRQMMQPGDFLISPGKRIAVGLELPRVIDRLNWLQTACRAASVAYFQGEAELVGDIPALAGAAVESGLFSETPILVSGVAGPDGAGRPVPSSIEQLVGTLGWVDDAAEDQIRVDRLTPVVGGGELSVTGALFLAYIPGTQIWAATAGKNVFDATSNVTAMAGRARAASERAVDEALKQAGAGRGDRVVLVGHSQGGIVAGNLASRHGYQSHDAKARGTGYQIAGVVTVGAPIGQLAQLNRVPTLSIEHTNDLVPKLDNKPNPLQSNWATAVRSVDADGLTGPHEIDRYRETAKLVDDEALAEGTGKSGLARIRSEILGVLDGQKIDKTSWFQLNRDLATKN